MHLHSYRYDMVQRMYLTALKILRAGEPIPLDFETKLIGAGINVEALREIVDYENRMNPGKSMTYAD